MKMTSGWRRFSGLSGLMLALLLAGCGGQPPMVAYYSLAALEPGTADAEVMAGSALALGIGPVTVPDYLKKPQIATRLEGRRYQFNDFHRWTGLLDKEIAALLGNTLGHLLQSEKIAIYPWPYYFVPNYRVAVDILQFDSDLNGEAVLNVRWFVSDTSGKKLLLSGMSSYRQALATPSYDALVDAERLVLVAFSKELAEGLQALTLRD